ncbi:MAG: hypothetical protein OEQ18_13465 [Gammaproteobacteria bacterium]|nr:hypothetical protein [Gammaproteobacteria bacterium]
MADQPKKRWWEIVAALTPLILGLGVTGLGTYATAVYRAQEIQLTQLKALNEWRELLNSDIPQERAFAYEAFVALGYESLVVKLVKSTRDPAGRNALSTVTTGQSSAEARQTLTEVPVYVFLHISDEKQRQEAGALRTAIEGELGYIVRGIEHVEKVKPPKTPEVRYFNSVDETAANKVADIMKANGLSGTKTKRVSFLKAKVGTVEVWYPNV